MQVGGFRIVESVHMTERHEDWSRVRSPSRARRRMRQGHRQNVTVREVPRKDAFVTPDNIAYVHPTVAAEMRRMIDDFSVRWSV